MKPEAAVFFSTNRGWPWGAPDYVWPMAAAKLLDAKIPVTAIVHPQAFERQEINELRARGAALFRQPPVVLDRGRFARLRRKLEWSHPRTLQLRRHLAGLERPRFFINQGGSFDILREDLLRHFLAQAGTTYDLFFRSNQYGPPMESERRQRAVQILDRAARCLFNSQWTRELAEMQMLHRLNNASIFPHFIRFPYENPLAWPEPAQDRTIRLATVSRIDVHHKGLDALLLALTQLPKNLPDWTLDCYGQGSDSGYLQEMVTWLRLDQQVRIHPYTTDIREIWKSHHLLILTSRYEGLAVSMLEAMACGRPVLRTPYGGCAEWLLPGETGFLCPAPEPELIAASLVGAMAAKETWPAMGLRAHRRIRDLLPRDPWQLYLEPFGLA